MPLRQDRVVLAAHVVAESAWVFALAGIVGTLAGFDSSPQSWYGVVGILGLSVLLSRITPRKGQKAEVMYALMAVLGLAVVYVSVALHVEPGQIRPLWAIDWLINDAPGGYTSRGLFGAILGVLLWWRGTRVSSNEFPTDDLSFTFRVGMLVLVAALIYDLNTDESLSTFPMVFLFFGSSLIGLSAGHLLEESRHSAGERTWPKAIGATVAGHHHVRPSGRAREPRCLVVPLQARDSGAGGAGKGRPLGHHRAHRLRIRRGRGLAHQPLGHLPGRARAAPRGGDQPGDTGLLGDTPRGAGGGVRGICDCPSDNRVGVGGHCRGHRIADPGSGVSAGAARTGPWHGGAARLDGAGREPRRGRREVGAPPRAGRAEASAAQGVSSAGRPAGIVEAFRLYYDLLDTAEEQGITRRKHDTPTEFQGRLEGTFPSDVVRPSTETFNLAIYADVPADRSSIGRLRQSLKDATAMIRRERDEEEEEDNGDIPW